MTYSRALALFQFGLSATCILLHGLHPMSLSGMAIGALGILTWTCGAMALGRGNLNMEPDTISSPSLVTRFPYNRIRHPMYTGLALLTLGFLISRPGWIPAIAWMGLLVVLNEKANIEEQILEGEFPEYRTYRQGTKRFLPFLW